MLKSLKKALKKLFKILKNALTSLKRPLKAFKQLIFKKYKNHEHDFKYNKKP